MLQVGSCAGFQGVRVCDEIFTSVEVPWQYVVVSWQYVVVSRWDVVLPWQHVVSVP